MYFNKAIHLEFLFKFLLLIASICKIEAKYRQKRNEFNSIDNLYWKHIKAQIKRSNNQADKNFDNLIKCNYQVADSLLVCHNKNLTKDIFECSADLNLSSLERFKFDMFGIEEAFTNGPELKYNLYPFKTNKKTKERIFYNHQMTINYRTVILSLFSSDKQEYSGIKVQNSTCFKNLVDLFSKSSKTKKAELNINAVNSLTKIVLIGFLDIIQQPKINLKHGSIIEETKF